jgi:hypothetical protein
MFTFIENFYELIRKYVSKITISVALFGNGAAYEHKISARRMVKIGRKGDIA